MTAAGKVGASAPTSIHRVTAADDAVVELIAADVLGARRNDRVEGAQSTAFADIARERVRWLWVDRIPVGMVTLLIGDPGLGKSLLTCLIAGQVSTAGGVALMLTAEDSPSATVRPRLEAVGADLARVRLVEVRRDGIAEGLALPDDIDALDRLVARDRAALVTIDPLTAHLPEAVNSWRDQSDRTPFMGPPVVRVGGCWSV